MCKYVEDFKKIFGEEEVNSKYKISRLGGIKEPSFNQEYDNLIDVFKNGFYDIFTIIPNVKSYLQSMYNCNSLEEYLEINYGKEILAELEERCGKIHSDGVYILLDTGINLSLRYEKVEGEVHETIRRMLLINSTYRKYCITDTIEKL